MGRRRKPGPKISPEDRDLHKAILTQFFDLQAWCRDLAEASDEEVRRGMVHPNHSRAPGPDELRRSAIFLWSLMQRAHIFEFTAEQYFQFRKEADVYTTEEVCGVDWVPRGVQPTTEIEDYRGKLDAAAVRVLFPEKLPFPTMWVAWGGGVSDDGFGGPVQQNPRIDLLGFLITDDPEPNVIEVNRIVWRGQENNPAYTPVPTFGKQSGYGGHYIRHPDDVTKPTWTFPMSLAPWIVTGVIRAINAQETFVEGRLASLWDREMAKKWTKRIKQTVIPPPYYRVYVKPKHVADQLRESPVRKEIEYSHRWDCRGNYATRVLRGPLTALTDEVREKLRKRRYDLWTTVRPPDGAALEILTKWKQMPPRVGEWVATKKWWRRESIKGPRDKPYIPSTRKLARSA